VTPASAAGVGESRRRGECGRRGAVKEALGGGGTRGGGGGGGGLAAGAESEGEREGEG